MIILHLLVIATLLFLVEQSGRIHVSERTIIAQSFEDPDKWFDGWLRVGVGFTVPTAINWSFRTTVSYLAW
jgi:hypothetical protein